MRGTPVSSHRDGGAEDAMVTEPQWAERSDYSPLAWRNHVRAARIKVKIDDRLGRPTPEWVRELAAEPLPELERPVKRRPAA